MRSFDVGDKVWYCIPRLLCKLSDSWEGPFEVIGKVGVVNYRISKSGKKRHSEVVHVNCLKAYVQEVWC